MNRKLYALLLEDVPKDAELLKEQLSDAGYDIRMDVVDTESAYVSCLKKHDYDIIFADFTLPSFNGKEALELAKIICPFVPFICISGTIGEDKAVELLKQGATDYVLKDRMERLPFATKRALDAAAQLSKFRKTEIELQTNRKLLQTIINNAIDAIFIKDLEGKYILINEASEKAIGKSSEEVIGKDDTFLYPAEEAQMIKSLDKQVIETETSHTFEEEVTLADGKKHIFHVIKCPMFDDFGKITGMFAIARDITEYKKKDEQLIVAKEKAEESDRLKTAFLHNISHEIRTPMNAIIGFSSFLNDADLDAAKRRQFTDIIIRSSNQLLSIITDIISISSIDAGQERKNEKEVDIDLMLKQLCEQFKLGATSKNLGLTLTLPPSSIEGTLQTDGTKLIQIISNLLVNALKFTKQGYINFGYALKDAMVEFFVEDTGIGIPSDMQSEVFERFRQVEDSVSRQFGGSGLGLSISKAYVEMLGGTIWMKSELGKGTTFYFTIPYKPIKKEIITGNKPADEVKLATKTPKTLLVAEDEDSNFLYIEEVLKALPVSVIRAINGLEAVEVCKANNTISLVLMDMKMPVMDGCEATRIIKGLIPSLPIIAQTAYSTDADKVRVLACGCDDFISKPIDRNLLISKLEKQLYIE